MRLRILTPGRLALQTSRIRLGTPVSSATFRLPGPLGIAVAQVGAMSVGGGWPAPPAPPWPTSTCSPPRWLPNSPDSDS